MPPIRSEPSPVGGRLDGLVVPGWRVLYVLNPKAATTSTLWWLAALADERPERLFKSRGPEVTRELTIHDLDLWRHCVGISDLNGRELARLLADPKWMRFTVVRHPVTRLWSAWHSKLLLREPFFVSRYFGEDWFPRVPDSMDDIRDDFRRFLAAISKDRALLLADPHWSPQHLRLELDVFPYTHVGKTECLTRTRGLLEKHVKTLGWRGQLPDVRTNATLLPISVAGLGSRELEGIETLFEGDMSHGGFESLRGQANPDSELREPEEYEALALAAVRELIARHERIGDLLKKNKLTDM